MQFTKKETMRAIREFIEYVNNITNAMVENYNIRLRQLFQLINNNEVLKNIILPYLNNDLDDSKIGFIETFHGRVNYIVPENEDEEISLMLKVLHDFSKNDNAHKQIAFRVFRKNSFEENVDLFHSEYVLPALNKLLRKMNYLLEDVNEMSDIIDTNKIQIIKELNIDATNSMVAIGTNIHQNNNSIFENLKNAISKEISDENHKKDLIELVDLLNHNKNDKKSFKEIYDQFLMKIGSYMTIIGPFLPAISDYFK